MKIELQGVTKKYGSFVALADVSLEIAPRQLVALLGPNGAGKTTLLRCLAGIVAPTKGRLLYDGQVFERGRMDLRRSLFFLPDFPFVFEHWNILRHIGMVLRLYQAERPGIEDKVIELLNDFELLPLAEKPFQSLSRGQRYKGALAALMAADPELWLVDEPFASGMDPHGISAFKRRSREATARGRTVIYSTQILDAAERFSDKVGIIFRGSMVAFDSVTNLEDPKLKPGGVLEGLFDLLRGGNAVVNLRLKPFEKSIRRRVRRELRASPAAWKEYRRVRKRREFHLPPWLFRFFVLLVLVSAWSSIRKPTGTLAAMTLLWAAASVTWRAGQLLIALRASPWLLVLAHVPIPDEEVFKFQWQMFLRQSLWSVLDFTALYGVLAERVGYGGNSLWVGLFMAMIQWLVVVSLATGLLIYVRKRRFFRFAAVFAALAMLLAIDPAFPSLTRFLTALAGWIPPTGWILYAVGISPEQNILFGWWPALALSAALFALPLFYRRLRTRYVMPEGVPRTEAVRGAVEAQRRSKSDGLNPDPSADIKAAIRTREFMRGFNWRRGGLVEQLTARWLTPEERVAAEFLNGGDPSWTRGLVKSSLFLAGLAVLLYLFPRILTRGFVPIFIFLSAKGFVFKGWPGTALRNVSGSNIALCSVYPLGFWQIARVSLKVNLARLAILLPFLGVIGYFALGSLNNAGGFGLQLAWKVVLIVLALQFFSPIRLLTPGTNDGTKIRMVLLTVLAVIIFGGSCLALFFADGLAQTAVAVTLLLGGSISALLVYGRAYNHNWFDLQNKPKTTATTQSQ